MFKSGFVSIVGRPNVGKSTLLNYILKTKLAITSPTAQTTRNTIQGIYTDEEAQIIFMDTPGIHKPQDGLGSYMNTSAINSLYGVDIVLFMAPADEIIGRGDKYIIKRLEEVKGPVYLILSKVDLLKQDQIESKLKEWEELYEFDKVIPISAVNGYNVDALMQTLKDELPEGEKYYPEDNITTQPEKFIMSEFIREKILYFTREEVPHSVAIVIESMKETESRVEINATIVVDHSSQKGIIIGKGGQMIKKIREAARKDMRNFLGVPVYLELFVKVEKNWRNKQRYLKEFGYDESNF